VRDKVLAKYNDVIRQLGKENNVEVVDIAQLFRKPGMAAYYNRPVTDWVHLNREGYDLVALEIAKVVLSPVRFY
jgi:lysophospholipase L1-like esterase